MFQIGEKVSFLRQRGTAHVIKNLGQKCIVKDEDGFEIEVLTIELVRQHSEFFPLNQAEESELPEPIMDDSLSNRQKRKLERSNNEKITKTGATRPAFIQEIDLHIEELVDSIRGLSNTEIVKIQLSVLKKKFAKAKLDKCDELIVIHGKGQGVLRMEVLAFLDKQEGIEVLEGDFRQYGQGATRILFHPNWRK